MKLNLGCGAQILDSWINVDYAPGARLAKIPLFRLLNKRFKLFNLDWDERIYIHNLTKKFFWKDNTVDIVYSSHTLEHLSREEGLKFLNECYRVLQKGGIIRIVVPDLESIVKEYSEKRLRADEFVEELYVLYGDSGNKIKNILAPFIQSPHKCIYDTQTLLTLLREIGFEAESKKPFDSDIEDIKKIEIKERTDNAVIAEGKKQ